MRNKRKSVQQNTVKLGYNELGYKELPVIANKHNILFGSNQFIRTCSRI